MIQCPNCRADLSTDIDECPGCGAVITDEARRIQDARYLAKDKWSAIDEPQADAASGVSGDSATGPDEGIAETASGSGAGPTGESPGTDRGYKVAVLKAPPDASALTQSAENVVGLSSDASISASFVSRRELPGRSVMAELRSNPIDSGGAFGTWLGVCAALLIVLWCVPEVVGVSVVFPFHLIRTTHGAALVALLAGPMAGALLMAVLIGPFRIRVKAALGLTISVITLSLPLISDTQPLVLAGPVVLAVACCAVAAAVAVSRMLDSWKIGHLVLALFPAALFGAVVYGVATGQHPLGHLAAFKEPVELYGTMLAAALCAAYLYNTRR